MERHHMESDEDRFKNWQAETHKVRKVLLADWDPIGVGDEPHAHDEYDDYVWPVYRLLTSGGSREAVEQLLLSIEKTNMGLDLDNEYAKSRRGKAAEKLVAMFG